jgi:ADP-heptose:LPS heptosyltransferase
MKHILISRTDNLGDVILTLPMAFYLKQKFPHCKISFLGKTYTQTVLRSCPWIDQVLLWDEWEKLPAAQLTSLIEGQKFDTVVHVFPRRAIANAMQKARVPLRIGTANRLYHWPSRCNRKLYFSRKNSDLHEAMLNIKLLSPIMDIGSISRKNLDEISPQLLRRPPMSDKIKSYLSESKINIILHPKSMGSAQEWGLSNFSQLINELSKNEKFQIFLTGSPSEGKLIQEELYPKLTSQSKQNLINTCGVFSLEELIDFIAHAQIFISNSTGPLHIASLYQLKTIGLFPASNLKPMHASRWSPLGMNVEIVEPAKDKHLSGVAFQIVLSRI